MKKWTRYLIYLTLVLSIPWSLGLDCAGNAIEDSKSLLYVLDNSNDAVYVYENIDTLDGAQDPVRTISGEKTLIENPTAIAVDPRKNILYVADATQKAILVFTRASTLDGDVTPARTLPVVDGNPQLMFLDWENDRLYVYNIIELNILVWDDVSTLDGENPTRFFELDFVASAIFVDTQRDLLYAGDPFFLAIQVYTEASRTIGSPIPARILTRSDEDDTDDVVPEFERVDSLSMNIENDILFVSESLDQAFEIFDEASTLDGAVEPDRILAGDQTQLTDDMRASLFKNNVLYSNNTPTTIAIWDDANIVDGNTAPNRLITINPAVRIRGFDIDMTN